MGLTSFQDLVLQIALPHAAGADGDVLQTVGPGQGVQHQQAGDEGVDAVGGGLEQQVQVCPGRAPSAA